MKKVFVKIAFYIVLFALFLTVGAALFLPPQIAVAADTIEVVKAPVSNLEGNETAGKSTIKLIQGTNEFYIPESYYVVSPTNSIFQYYTVEYVVNSPSRPMYIEQSQLTTENITLAENESLFPDVRLTLTNQETSLLSQRTVNDNIDYVIASIINNEYTIKLLGFNDDSSKVYVVAILNGETLFGFISVEDLEPFTVPYQQRAQAERDALIAAKEEQKNPFGVNPENTSVALRIILIVGIAVPTVIIILLLFKPSKNERRYSKNTVRNSRSRDDFDYDDSRSYRGNRDDRDYDRDYDRRDSRGYDDRRDYDRRYDDRRDYDRRDDREYRDYRDRDYRDRDYDRN